MTRDGVRIPTAVLLALGAVLFSVGTQIERAGHVETAAQHAAENGTAAPTSPSPVPSQTPSKLATTASSPTARPTPKSTPTRDPGLSAPEGSKEREAAEHRKREAAASAAGAPRTPSPHASVAPGASGVPPTAPATAAAVPDASASEGSAAREAAEAKTTAGGPGHSEARERLLGINTESTPVIVVADLLALVLIGLVLLLTGGALRLAGLAVAASGLGAVALDIREAIHQQGLGKTGLVVLVVGVALLHLGSSAGGAVLARGTAPGAAPEP